MPNSVNDHSPLNQKSTKKLRFAPEVAFEIQTLEYDHSIKEYSQQSDDLFDTDLIENLTPSTPRNLFSPSVGFFQSEKINIPEIIDALVSQKTQPILDTSENIATSDICDVKNVPVDELIQMHDTSQERMNRLIAEIVQDSS